MYDGVRYSAEVRSVNHRYLDIKIRLPRELSAAEGFVRREVEARLARGRVDVNLSAGIGDASPPSHVAVNRKLAAAVRAAHAELAAHFAVPDVCDSSTLAAWPGVIEAVAPEADEAEAAAALGPALGEALDALSAMRAAEGDALSRLLSTHLDAIEKHRAVLLADAPAQATAYRARLESRLREMLDRLGADADPTRVVHEVAVFAERTDVAEELGRLASHLAQARDMLAAPSAEGVGRRLDFLCQEMFREANTIGSKVQSVEMVQRVVELKAELERLREQVQNVE
ncbi:MAG: YicC family protein [Myxococcales bacterium]|nr:YicC family protein [Myxococcales bacterium]